MRFFPTCSDFDSIDFDSASNGVKVGDLFWLFGGSGGKFTGWNIPPRRETRIWHITKQVWLQGPTIPNNIFLYHTSAVAINSTAVIFVGANTDYIEPTFDGTYLENFAISLAISSRIF